MGAKHAYALDGGQTAVLVMNNQVINRVVFNSQRKVSDIVYFATALPSGVNMENLAISTDVFRIYWSSIITALAVFVRLCLSFQYIKTKKDILKSSFL